MKEKKKWVLCTREEMRICATMIIICMVTAILLGPKPVIHADVPDLPEIEQNVNTTLMDSIEIYAGIFSTTVTSSVNPTATLAALAVIGVIEKSDVYAPNVAWLQSVEQFLDKIPFVRTIGDLPISNPVCAILLIVIALGMYLLHSGAVSKLVSEASVDKVEKWVGMFVTIALSFFPLATSHVVTHAASDDLIMRAAQDGHYVTVGTYLAILVLALGSAIFNAIVYFCIYRCIDAVELLAAVIPLKGMNIIVQIAKAILHVILVILQVLSPFLSVAISIILMIIGLLLFHKLTTVYEYYRYIYVHPIWRAITRHGEKAPFVHEKFPRRGLKKYPGVQLAIPTFSAKRTADIRKKELVWLIIKEEKPYVVRIRPFRRVKEIPLADLNVNSETLYLQKRFRFTRIMTENHEVELIISNEYSHQWNELLAKLQMIDYRIVEEERERVKEEARSAKEAIRRAKREAVEREWEGKFSRLMEYFYGPERIPVAADNSEGRVN